MPVLVPPPTSLVLWLEADVGVYKDTAGTTPATADGDPVARWKDQSGNGNDVSQATTANQPSLKLAVAGSNLKPAVRFTQASTTRLATAGSVAHGIGTGGFWFAAVWQTRGAGTNIFQTALSIGALQPAIYLPNHPSSGAPWFTELLYTGVIECDFSANISGDNIFYLTEMARVSGVIQQWQSSGGAAPVQDSHTYSTAVSIPNAAITVGWDTSGADASNGDLAEILLYSSNLTTANQAALENYLRAKYWSTGPGAVTGGAPLIPHL